MAKRDPKQERLIKELDRVERRLRKIYGDTYRAAIEIKAVRKAIERGEEFTWSGNPAAAKQLNRLIDNLTNQTNTYLRNSTSEMWKQGERNAHNALAAVFSTNKKSEEEVESITEQAQSEMRKKGATARNYFNEERGGFTISDRVWNITDASKKELEAIIQNGIIQGKNPDQIAKSVQPYLREPNKLFRRVRNKETGQLELSKAAKEYRPGRGVYRSSYKNALRLARTEMTAAYRRAEWETYQSNPLITGFKIELSNNHTTLVNGVPTPFHDICDDMVGDYPKTFKWTGWHPQCRCRMTPIMIDKSDFRSRMKALAEGKLNEWKPKSTVTDMPENFKKWIQENSSRIPGAKSLPYWMQDNLSTINNILTQPRQISTFTLDENTIARLKEKGWGIEIEGDIKAYQERAGSFNAEVYGDEMSAILKKAGVEVNKKTLRVRRMGNIDIILENEKEHLEIHRNFTIGKKREKIVRHLYFNLPERLQGKGLSKELTKIMYKQYQSAGIEEIRVGANITIGGYAWAKYGFHVPRGQMDMIGFSHERHYLKFKQVTDQFFRENPSAQSFPMQIIADQPWGKEMLLGSDWAGFLDLTDDVAVELFENYLFRSR